VQVRNPLAAAVETENSAFMSAALPLTGFAVTEAADLSEEIPRHSFGHDLVGQT
jgi:hypothetical protein